MHNALFNFIITVAGFHISSTKCQTAAASGYKLLSVMHACQIHWNFLSCILYVLSEVKSGCLSSQAPAATADSSVLATTLYPIVSIVVILLSNAVIITIMLFIFLCWTRKRNNHKNTRPDRLTVRSVHIQDNVCYATTVPGNE